MLHLVHAEPSVFTLSWLIRMGHALFYTAAPMFVPMARFKSATISLRQALALHTTGSMVPVDILLMVDKWVVRAI